MGSYLEKLGVRNPYMLDKLHVEPKIRPLGAMAPKEEHRVVKGAVGQAYVDESDKTAFAVSEYSGALSDGGPLVYTSYIPPFKSPPVKTAGPPSEYTPITKLKTKEECVKISAMLDEFCKLNNVSSPKAQLTKTMKVGTPRATTPPGPSVQQISKPVGFGRPIAGATKGSV